MRRPVLALAVLALLGGAACGGEDDASPAQGPAGASGAGGAGQSGAGVGGALPQAGAGGKITCKHHPSKITIVDAGCEDCVLQSCCPAVNACEDSPACLECWQKGGGGVCWSNLEWGEFHKCVYAPDKCGATCAGKCGGFQSDEACTTCVASSCCDAWAACAGDPLCHACVTKGGALCDEKPPATLTAALACTDAACAKPCGTPQPVCDSGYSVPGDAVCAGCLGDKCCGEFKACFGDAACAQCAAGAPVDCTAQKPKLDALTTCAAQCKESCP